MMRCCSFVGALLLLAAQHARAAPRAAAPLYQACAQDDPAAVADALAQGADVDAADAPGDRPGGQTPLMFSVLRGSGRAVKALLEAGADTSIPEKDGYTPMHGAGFQGRPEIARYLVEVGGLSPSDRHTDGYTPLQRSCWGSQPNHAATVKVLLELGADPKELDNCRTSNPGIQQIIDHVKGGGAVNDL